MLLLRSAVLFALCWVGEGADRCDFNGGKEACNNCCEMIVDDVDLSWNECGYRTVYCDGQNLGEAKSCTKASNGTFVIPLTIMCCCRQPGWMISDKFLVTCFSGTPSDNGRAVSWFSPEQTGEDVVLDQGYCRNAHAFYSSSLLPHIIVGMLCAIVITSIFISFYRKKIRSQFVPLDTNENNNGNELRTSLLSSTTQPVALAASGHDGEELPTAECHALPVAPDDVDGMAPGSLPYAPPLSTEVIQISEDDASGGTEADSDAASSTEVSLPIALASPVNSPIAVASPASPPVAVASPVSAPVVVASPRTAI
jgi:hypothetical protein